MSPATHQDVDQCLNQLLTLELNIYDDANLER